MMKRKLNSSFVLRFVIAIVVTASCILLFSYALGTFLYGSAVKMTDGWSVTYKGKTYRNVDLYRFRFPDRIRKNDMVILYNNFPKTIGQNMNLAFQGELSAVSVYINNKSVYSYSITLDGSDKVPGNAVHIVTLPDDVAGGKCLVQIRAGTDDAFDVLPIFYLVPARYSSASYTSINLVPSLAAFFLFAVGIVMIAVSIVMAALRRHFMQIFTLGSLAFCIGTWTLCTSHVIEFFSSEYLDNTRLGYMFLYIALIPMVGLIAMIRREGRKKWQKAIMAISFGMAVAFLIYAYMSDHRNGETVELVDTYQIVAALSFALMFVGTANRHKVGNKVRKIVNGTLLTSFICGMLDIIRDHVKNRIIVENRLLYSSIIPFVIIGFIFAMIVAYLTHINEHYMKKAKEQVIKKLALTDVLTGLRNRAYCINKFHEFDSADNDVPFQMVSMDVNGLKKVNDSLGHAAGDQLIKDCARILTQSFTGIGEVVRMGGDEFLILIKDGKYKEVKRALGRMERLESQYELKRKYEIKISYGIASSDEKEGLNSEAVYRRADERMYVMKKETKYVR